MRTRWFVLAAFVMMVGRAHASDGVALEAYTGERPKDASRLLSPILDELARQKITFGDTVGRLFETAVSRPAKSAEGLPGDFEGQIERGFKLFSSGKFDDAMKVLGPLVEAAHANSGAFAKDPLLREPLRKGMIALALSQQRAGDLGAMRATFSELARSFPGDAAVPRATYGPEAFDAFEQVRRDLGAAGRGKLTVKVVGKGGTVFIDEAYRASGTTTVELPPGEYRVVLMANDQPSRTHFVGVRAGAESLVVVDTSFDQTVNTTGWTGFAFDSEADRDAHEAGYAAQLANAIGARSVAVVGIEPVKGHAAIVGSLISLETGREIRRASVALDPDPSADRLRALARFLAGEPAAEGLEVLVGGRGTVAAAEPGGTHEDGGEERVPNRWGGWRWIVGGAAVGTLGAAGVLFALDGRCHDTPMAGRPCTYPYDNSPGEWYVLGGGVVLAGLATYLFATQSSHPARTAYLAPTLHGGAVAGIALTW